MDYKANQQPVIERQFVQIDEALALGRVGGDFELLQEVVGLFLDDYPKTLREIQAALTTGDASGVERYAHSLKGSVSTFGAKDVFESALALEKLGRSGDLSCAPEAVAKLEQSLSSLHPELEALLHR